MSDIRGRVRASLKATSNDDLIEAAKDLLAVLGYRSDRTLELSGDVDGFIDEFPARKSNTRNERAFRKHVQSVRIVFQLTNDEIAPENPRTLRDRTSSIEEGRQESILFFAVELKGGDYPRGIYDEFTREIDKRVRVPTVVLFRSGALLTIAVISRRPNKLDINFDVLERVTSLSREIHTDNPRRSDLDVLADLSLAGCTRWLDANRRSCNCDGLLTAWLSKLDTTERGQTFYGYTQDWLEQVESEARFPAGEENNLRLYFNDVAECTPLSREREVELASRIRYGDMEARDEMICANLRFVISEARKHQSRGVPLSDLISAGNIGLIEAVDRFDGTLGHKFITYAVWWIRQSILKTIDQDARVVRLPLKRVSLLNRILRILNLGGASETTLGACSTELEVPSHAHVEEIAAELGLPVETVVDTFISGLDVLPLDNPSANHRRSLPDTLVDEKTAPPDAEILRKSTAQHVLEAVELLEPRESEVLKLYFGLDGAKSLTLEEISYLFNLSRERIRQIKETALKRLRRRACFKKQELLTKWPFTSGYGTP